MIVQPYLFLDGRCEEAIEFYKFALGASVERLMRFKDNPEPHGPAGNEEKVMHASLRVGDTVMMLSDGHCKGRPFFYGFSLSLSVSNEAEADRMFAGLTDGGTVITPLTKTFFSPRFGMVTDRFGVMWMIIAHPG
jgi:PhnB protein